MEQQPQPQPAGPKPSPISSAPPPSSHGRAGWLPGRDVAGRYDVERLLGTGAMGDVYLAHDSLLKKQVALKVLHAELAENRDTVRRFLREVALAHSVTHKGVVRIYDTGEEEGQPFFTMEYLQGETLEEVLEGRDERLGVAEIREISFDVLDAMEAAHRVGVIHRDLKPANVMLTHRGAIVMDFGVAGIDEVAVKKPSTDSLASLVRTEAGTIFGSPAYMAPELWEGAHASVQSDLYAFGVLVYQMLTGRLPYEGKSPSAYLQQLSAGRPRPIRSFRRDTPWNLVRLVGHCMARSPLDRPAGAEAAANLISPLRSRDRRRFAIAAAVVAVGAVGFAMFRADPSWNDYGLPDALAEADFLAAVRAYDAGDNGAALRGLDRLKARAADSAAVAFWRAAIHMDLGDDQGRLDACEDTPRERRGGEVWQALATHACGATFSLPPAALATLDGDDAVTPLGPELIPLAVAHDLLPRLEAGGRQDPAWSQATALLDKMTDEPDLPPWGLPIRYEVARADLELALGKVGDVQERLATLIEAHPNAPLPLRRAAWLALLTSNVARARELAAHERRFDPVADLRLWLEDGQLDRAWDAITLFDGTRRFPALRAMWCGYALRFDATTPPKQCSDLAPGLVSALWGQDDGGSLGPLERAIVARKRDVDLGACDSDGEGEGGHAPMFTHAPPPFERMLAELEVEAMLCARAPQRGNLERAQALAGNLASAAPQDPWALLLRARVEEAAGAVQLAHAHRLAVAERWRQADPHLPRVGRLREAIGAEAMGTAQAAREKR